MYFTSPAAAAAAAAAISVPIPTSASSVRLSLTSFRLCEASANRVLRLFLVGLQSSAFLYRLIVISSHLRWSHYLGTQCALNLFVGVGLRLSLCTDGRIITLFPV